MQRFVHLDSRIKNISMRRLFSFGIVLITVFAFQSCKKRSAEPEATDIPLCVQRHYYSQSAKGEGITDAQMDTVYNLFRATNLSLNNLQVIRYIDDAKYNLIHLFMNQFVNGLLVFGAEVGFHFHTLNGNYTIDSLGMPPEENFVHTPAIDSAYKISPLHAANILYQQMTKDLQTSAWQANWKDSCYAATLGLSIVNGKEPHSNEAKYGLVWQVTPQNNQYPICYVDAMSGKMIYYFDGILTMSR
ncbi:MAG TPA: hypothetical protein VN726_23175 [Hanamia sp.]|nr:hypothetical protein [Hanamia sp.]